MPIFQRCYGNGEKVCLFNLLGYISSQTYCSGCLLLVCSLSSHDVKSVQEQQIKREMWHLWTSKRIAFRTYLFAV